MNEIRPVPFDDQELTGVAARMVDEKRSRLARNPRFELHHDRFSSNHRKRQRGSQGTLR